MDPTKEPRADQRESAREMFGMYNAMLIEGFPPLAACTIIGTMLGVAARPDKAGE